MTKEQKQVFDELWKEYPINDGRIAAMWWFEATWDARQPKIDGLYNDNAERARLIFELQEEIKVLKAKLDKTKWHDVDEFYGRIK